MKRKDIKNDKETALFRERLENRRKELKLSRKQLADNAGISESIIDKWINGNKDSKGEMYYVPPSFALLKKVSRALDVSTDYFIDPDMECLTVTNQKIHNITGLSDSAIHTLQLEKSENEKMNISRVHILDMVNYFLSDSDSHKLLTALYNYLFGNYQQAANGETTIDLIDNTGIPVNGGTLLISDINSLFLSQIMEMLPQLKAKTSANPSYINYGKFNPDNATEIGKALSDIPSFLG